MLAVPAGRGNDRPSGPPGLGWRACPTARTRARARRTSSSTGTPGQPSAGHRAAADPRGDRPRPRARGRARPRGGAAGLPAAVGPAQPLREVRDQAAPGDGGVPAPAAAAAHAVRHRAGGLGGRRQVHDGPRAAADAGPLARAPPRLARHHRRVPAAQRRASSARPARPQGLPGVLRPQGPAEVRHRHQVRQGRGRGSHLLAPRVRRRARRADRDLPTRHRRDRGPQRAPVGAGAPGRAAGPRGQRLLRLLGLRGRGDQRHPPVVHRPVPPPAPDRVPRPRLLLRPLRGVLRGRGGRGGQPDLGRDQRPQPRAERQAHPLPRDPRAPQGPRPLRALGASPQAAAGSPVSPPDLHVAACLPARRVY